ncbi:hypothetical protein TWF281_011132 [Arthrobotrys megalospora]
MTLKPETWALLIGVNHYLPGAKRRVKYNDLSGCVKDVKSIKSYLEKTNVRHITTLTSTKGPEGPEEEESQLPKHPNVTRELERIINDSNPGDLVYIHYSGHGIRRDAMGIDPDEEQNEGDSIAGTALALADVMTGGAYLTGYQLGIYIKRMVIEKQLRVTVVLDSCFSGRGLREAEVEEYTLRCGEAEFDDEILDSDLEADKIAELSDVSFTGPNDFASRNATKIRSWLSDPTGCTVLTACDIDETAGEYTFDGEKHGILTYWMLKFLVESPETCRPTYAKVKEYVEQNIERARLGKKQSPVLWGDTDHTFLGREKVIERPVGHVVSRNLKDPNTSDIVELDIGWAHGVAAGAIYDVFPAEENIRIDSIPKVKAQITEVPHNNPFRSKAVLQYAPDDSAAAAQIKPGSSVVLKSWSLPSDAFVDISSLRQRLSEEQIRVFESETKKTCGLLLDSDASGSEECDFKLTINQSNFFEVLENGKRMSRVPMVSLDDENWATKLAYLLSHLARFRALLSIDNSIIDGSLKPEWFSFDVDIEDEGFGDDLQPAEDAEGIDAIRVYEGTDLRFTFSMNKICQYDSVYVSFYSFDASWGIDKVHNIYKVTKDTPQEFGLRMMIPPKSDPKDTDDIMDNIRVFISTSKTYWEDITLLGLPNHACSLPPSIVTLPTNPTDLKSEETARSPGGFSDSDTDDTDSYIPRNPKRIPLKKRQQKGGWGIMDLKISTVPKN